MVVEDCHPMSCLVHFSLPPSFFLLYMLCVCVILLVCSCLVYEESSSAGGAVTSNRCPQCEKWWRMWSAWRLDPHNHCSRQDETGALWNDKDTVCTRNAIKVSLSVANLQGVLGGFLAPNKSFYWLLSLLLTPTGKGTVALGVCLLVLLDDQIMSDCPEQKTYTGLASVWT